MNRELFMRELAGRLSRLPEEERLAAMQYYEEYFDEAGPDMEEEVIRGLGSPSDIAKQLLAEFVVKEAEVKPMKPKQSFQAVWIVIAALFAGPIALPLAFVVAILVFAGFVTIGSLVFAGVITAVALLGAASIVLVVGIKMLFIQPATGLVMVGGCLALIGVGLLVGLLMYIVIGKGLPMIAKGVISLFNRLKGGTATC